MSLDKQKFGEVMGTYRIFQHQGPQRAGRALLARPVRRPEVTPSLRPADAPSVHPNKCASDPAFPVPCEQRQPAEARSAEQKGTACASVPAMPLHFLHVDTADSLRRPVPCRPEPPGPAPA